MHTYTAEATRYYYWTLQIWVSQTRPQHHGVMVVVSTTYLVDCSIYQEVLDAVLNRPP